MTESVLNRARRFFSGMFLHPDTDDFGTPDTRGFDYEEVRFPSGDHKLHGFLIRGAGPVRRGTVLHCHGNAGNVTAHFPLVGFLARAGYDVLTFDYAGFGRSEGRATLPGIEEDARSALVYLFSRPDIDRGRVAVFGQSLGGAAGAAAAVHPRVRCLILEATFTTYRSMARATFVGRALLPLVPLVIPEGGPARHLEKFAPRPVLLLHGDSDTVVPVRFSRRLHAQAKSHSRLVIARRVDHLTTAGDEVPEFAEAVLAFLSESLPPQS